MSAEETIEEKEFNLKQRDMKRDNKTGRWILISLFVLKVISAIVERHIQITLLSSEYFIKGIIGIFFILAASNGLHNAIDKKVVQQVTDKLIRK